MDPVSAFGLISGAVQIVQVIGQTIAGLATLRGKFNNADLTIRSLIGELTTIKSAVTQLDDWAKYNARDSAEHNDYDEGLDVALEGCRAAMDVLSEEVSFLTQNTTGNGTSIGFRTRVKVVWNEEIMQGHQERLRAQVLALQLLLQACQCRTSSEQIELLRRVESRQIIQKVADDTATLRTRSNYAASRADSLSQNQPSVGDTVFDFDDIVVTSMAYRRALQHSRSKSEQQTPIGYDTRSRTTDEGYASGVVATPNGPLSPGVSPIQQMGSISLPIRPYDPVSPEHSRSKSASFNTNPLQSGKGNVGRWQSDSAYYSRTPQSSGFKRERLRSVLRRLSTPIGAELKVIDTRDMAASPIRDRESDTGTSIDFTSPEGASAPQIVKTAQTGTSFDIEKLIESGHDVEARHIYSRRNALLVAAHCGNEHIVNLLIRNNARLNVVDGWGCTALHLAASHGHCGVLALLLLENIDLEARNSHGQTALWLSAARGQRKTTRVLISNHAKVNARADNQMTALHAAAKRGDVEIVQLLILHGADLEAKDAAMKTALHYACEEGSLSVIELLLNNKANIEVPGNDRRTPLICAAATGKLLVVQLLLKRKASSRSSDDSAMTALHWAAFNGHTEIVDLICQKKGSLAMANVAGRTALHLAVMNAQFAVVELLLRKKVSLRTRCQSGLDPLHYACMTDSLEIARLLLISGSDIEAQADGDQRRPVHIAAARGSMGLLSLLCDKGASLDARDAVGDRALCVACRHGHAAAVQKLLERRSPLYQRFGSALHEDSPLCLAAMGGHLAVVTLLLQHGASVLRRDEMGWQPFRYAAYYGHPGVLRLLLSVSPELIGDGPDFGLTADSIGFALHVHISEERKKAVSNLLNQAYRQHARVEPQSLPPSLFSGAPMSTPLPRPFQGSPFMYVSSQGPVSNVIPQELPSTLEHGLPSSRSHTPEQMHGDSNFPGNVQPIMSMNEQVLSWDYGPTEATSVAPRALPASASRLLNRTNETPEENGTEIRPETTTDASSHLSFNPPDPNHGFQYPAISMPQPNVALSSARVDSTMMMLPEFESAQYGHTPTRSTFVFGPLDEEPGISDSESITTVYTAPEESATHDNVHELAAS